MLIHLDKDAISVQTMSVVCDHGASLRLLVHLGKRVFVIVDVFLQERKFPPTERKIGEGSISYTRFYSTALILLLYDDGYSRFLPSDSQLPSFTHLRSK